MINLRRYLTTFLTIFSSPRLQAELFHTLESQHRAVILARLAAIDTEYAAKREEAKLEYLVQVFEEETNSHLS